MHTFTKDPNAVLDYIVDWTAYLGDDTITTSTWIVPAGITKNSDTSTTKTAKVWLEGGTAGERYAVTNRITTAGGRTDDRTIRISCNER